MNYRHEDSGGIVYRQFMRMTGELCVSRALTRTLSLTGDGTVGRRVRMREKWAGANSNRGYGHPKAEGYQATPPART
jgi:hypothetical protein